jgi:threonine dehydrogenase-like Zn-dependent dehydrogenase
MDGLAFRIPAPGQIELRPFSDPSPLPADHIAGPALASAVSPGTEIACAYRNQDPAKPPSGTGYAMVFRVAEAGADSGFAPGDIAFVMTGHASYVRCRASDALRVPAGVAPTDAALARLAGVSWSTLTTTAARPPAKIAITGLGIVGNLAAQIFAASGYRVLACDPNAGRRELLAGRGIELRERLPLADPEWAGQLDLIIDCSGHEAATLDACKAVRKGGEVVLVGVPWVKRTELAAFDVLHAVFHRYVHLRSGWEWEVPREASDFRMGSIRGNTTAAMQWLSDGRLHSAGIVRIADPRDCATIYRELQQQTGGYLTAVFDWTKLESGTKPESRS